MKDFRKKTRDHISSFQTPGRGGWGALTSGLIDLLERLRFTFTPNGKRDFVPRDQVFPLIFPLLFIVSTQK